MLRGSLTGSADGSSAMNASRKNCRKKAQKTQKILFCEFCTFLRLTFLNGFSRCALNADEPSALRLETFPSNKSCFIPISDTKNQPVFTGRFKKITGLPGHVNKRSGVKKRVFFPAAAASHCLWAAVPEAAGYRAFAYSACRSAGRHRSGAASGSVPGSFF